MSAAIVWMLTLLVAVVAPHFAHNLTTFMRRFLKLPRDCYLPPCSQNWYAVVARDRSTILLFMLLAKFDWIRFYFCIYRFNSLRFSIFFYLFSFHFIGVLYSTTTKNCLFVWHTWFFFIDVVAIGYANTQKNRKQHESGDERKKPARIW